MQANGDSAVQRKRLGKFNEPCWVTHSTWIWRRLPWPLETSTSCAGFYQISLQIFIVGWLHTITIFSANLKSRSLTARSLQWRSVGIFGNPQARSLFVIYILRENKSKFLHNGWGLCLYRNGTDTGALRNKIIHLKNSLFTNKSWRKSQMLETDDVDDFNS